MSDRHGFPWWTAVGAGLFFVGAGLWALVSPESFFEQAAAFEPYNQHFIQDIGAFQIGIGAVLLIAAFDRRGDALSTALLGSGVGAAAHVISHLVGTDLGGRPEVDIPSFTIVGGLVLAGGIVHRRRTNAQRANPPNTPR